MLEETLMWIGIPSRHWAKSVILCFAGTWTTYVLCGSMDKRENKILSIMSALRRSTANMRILEAEFQAKRTHKAPRPSFLVQGILTRQHHNPSVQIQLSAGA